MELIIFAALSIFMILAAVFSILSKTMSGAVIASGIVSLFASILYIILGAPDVAMTEAAIGSGLMTALFFIVLSKIRRDEND